MTNSKKNGGFTLIELLVIIGVLAMLSTTLIIYSRTGERQIALFKEQARIISAISRAKYLSVNTFGKTGVPCGYGVHFEAPRTFIIFKDLAGDCSVADNRYSGNSANDCGSEPECFEKLNLDSAIKFQSLSLTEIFFIPPEPSVVITPPQDQAAIVIQTIDAGSSVTVKINSAGQISR